MTRKMSFRIVLAITILACISASAIAQVNNRIPNDVAMELIGQVTNPSPSAAFQAGYLSYLNGTAAPIFSGATQNETTALLTFYSDNVTRRVINNGSLRIINRDGTFTIYYDGMPNGNFASPDTFRDGQAVLTASLKQQVIIDTITSAFTATFVLTITSNDFFVLSGSGLRSEGIRMGNVGDTLKLNFQGHLNSPAPPSGYIAGYIDGGSLINR